MKKTVLRPKKEKKQNQNNIIIQNKEKKEDYLDSDLEEPENKKIYENIIERIHNKELASFKKIDNTKVINQQERNNRYKDMKKTDRGEKKLRRKTVDRGGKYNNIQATYIIYSKKDIDFHIVEPNIISLDKPLVYDKNRKRKEPKGKVKITYKSSCDNVTIRHKDKNQNKGKTVIYYHCAEIKQKDLDKKNKNKTSRNTNNLNIITIPRKNNIGNDLNNKKEKIKVKKETIVDTSKKMFLLKYYFRIFINKIKKKESEYEKWFKRHSGNDKNKENKGKIKNMINYLYPKVEYDNDITKKMPYDEWFNRNCEKSENYIKNQEEKKSKMELMEKLRKIILEEKDENESLKKMDEILNEFDFNKKRNVLNSLKSNLGEDSKKKQLNNIIEIYNNIEKEEEQKELIKSAKDDSTKNKIENLINLWEDENKNLLTSEEKNKLKEEISNLFKKEEKSQLIDELSKLNKKDRLEIIDTLKKENKSKTKEIDELNNLSEINNKLNNLIKILSGKKQNEENKEKIKKILDILLPLDKYTRMNCINYLRKRANEDEKKNIEFLSIINSLPEETEEKHKLQKDIFNYSFSYYSTSLDKINNSEINTEEKKEKEKEIEDDIFDILNDIDKEEDKKRLAEDEFKEISDNMIFNLYENDDDINDEEINKIVSLLNDLENKDKMKTMEKLKEKADNEKKKKIFSKLRNKIMLVRTSKKLIQKLIVEKEKEKVKTGGLLDDLKSDTSEHLLENKENEESNTNNKMHKTINFGKGLLNLYSDKLKNNLTFMNRTGSFKKVNKKVSFIVEEDTNDNKENLDKDELKKLINNIENDLFEEREKPLDRKEERKNEKDNNNKLKELSKVISSLSQNDQNKLFEKIRLKANNEYKISQLIKLFNKVQNIKKIKQYAEDNMNKKEEELSEKEFNDLLNKIKKELFNNEENDKEEKIKEISDIISNLNENQKNKIMEELELKYNNNNIFLTLKKKIKESNEAKNLLKTIFFNKSKIIKEEIKESEENKETNAKEIKLDLNEEDKIKIVEAILYQLCLIDKINPEKIYINEVENYLLKKDEKNKLKELKNIMDLIKKEDKEEILGILTYILENNNEFIKKLNEEMGIKNERIEKLLEEYKKENNIKELDDNKLEELTENIMTDIMKEFTDNEKRTEAINKAANIVINLNKNDQEKVLSALNHIKKNEYQKENVEKLNNLIENLNYMRLYLFSINQDNFLRGNDKDLSSIELNNIKKDVKNQIFNENDLNNNNIDKIALRLSVLSNKDQNVILNEINGKSLELNDNSRKSVGKLNQLLKSIKFAKMLQTAVKNKKQRTGKKKLTEFQMKELTYTINDKLINNKNPNNWTEKLLIDKNDERKIKNLAESINIFDEESKRKTMSFLTKNIVNDKQKKEINKLKDSLMVNNDKKINNNNKNITSSQFYMIKSLGITELNDDELNLLIETFSKDLFSEEIMEFNKREDNLNLIANLIKELDEENQNKIMVKLENKPEAKNNENLMNDLRDRILQLNLLKDELREEKEEKIANEVEYEEEDLIEDLDEDNDKTVTVEISADDIDEDDINDICQVFQVNFEEDEKKKKNKNNLNMSILANSMIKLSDKSQKKITDKLGEKLTKEEEKKQLEELLQNLQQLNNCKKLGKEIKDKKEKDEQIFREEIGKILSLNDNGKKGLDEENRNILMEEIINILFNDINVDFDKNELIKDYLTESKKEENIWKNAEKIDSLTEQDKETILNEIKTKANNDNDKMDIYNKLCKALKILEKIKAIKSNVELKKNDLIEVDRLKSISDNPDAKIELLIQKLNKENAQKDDIVNLVNEILKLDDINQESFLNNLREKITNKDKDFILKQIDQLLTKKKSQKKFAFKVLERYVKNIIIEKEKNEKKFGIFIDDQDKRGTILLKKPTELKNNNFNEMKNNFLEDLRKLKEENEEKGDKDEEISYLDQYKKKKEKEKKLEEISDVINSLNTDDKIKILEEIKKNFDNPNDNNLYNEFIEILEKRERRFNEEKREKKNETYKEIEDKKESEDNNLLYSFIDNKNEKNNNSSDIVNFSEDAFDIITNINNENADNKGFTFHKGNLETQEIY